ncbi:hypothetical protein ACFRH6_16855 [Streptomyces sp. NPDC056749]|uniref:hypothetical protein n=1 Tax=Streptomyces sp. NPDC056749 TaxID=3345936 RepID=UPI0036CE62DA
MPTWAITVLISIVLTGVVFWVVVGALLTIAGWRALARLVSPAPDAPVLGLDPRTGFIWAQCESGTCRGVPTEHDHTDTGEVQCMRCGHTPAL